MGINISEYRKYARENGMVILAFVKETYSNELIGVAVKTKKRWDGTPYYTFGRVYCVNCGNNHQFIYQQQGCASFNDEREVRMAAYKFFGIK